MVCYIQYSEPTSNAIAIFISFIFESYSRLANCVPPVSSSLSGSTAPGDYDRTLNHVFQFTPSATSLSVFVPIVDDDDIEDVESFLANLEIDETIFPDVILNPTPATVDIISNDGTCSNNYYVYSVCLHVATS